MVRQGGLEADLVVLLRSGEEEPVEACWEL